MTRWPLSEAKAPECPLFSCVLSHKTMFFFYFPFTAESLPLFTGSSKHDTLFSIISVQDIFKKSGRLSFIHYYSFSLYAFAVSAFVIPDSIRTYAEPVVDAQCCMLRIPRSIINETTENVRHLFTTYAFFLY